MNSLLQYLDDPELKAFFHHWYIDERIPFVVQDWLLDRGFDREARVAEWAHNTFRGKFYGSNVYVRPFNNGKFYVWTAAYLNMNPEFGSVLERPYWFNLKGELTPYDQAGETTFYSTFAKACCDLLENVEIK